jgi:acyl-CoA thioester hydrolase
VERVGNTSIRYGIAIFREDEQTASAAGHFVHVYVDRATQLRPTALPDKLRAVAAAAFVAVSEDGV